METLTQPANCPEGFKTGELAYGLEAGGMHALVDFACGAVVYREVAAARLPYEVLIGYVLFYNAMAFGLQAGVGWLADLRGHHRVVAASGPCLVSIGVACGISMPWVGVAMAGLGNACFHVGAAGALLPLCRGRALAPGLFVGPGAIGIFAGVWTGANVGGWETVTLVLLLSVGIRLWFLVPSQVALPSGHSLRISKGWVLLVAGALFASVTVRGVVAGVLAGEWRSSVAAGLALAISACCGKCLGGWLADRYGWRASAVTALVMSSPLMILGMEYLPLAIIGMLLFQSTMAVTLTGTYVIMPHRPGLAFGVPSLALLLSALPGLASWFKTQGTSANFWIAALMLVSAALLWFGLDQARRALPGLHVNLAREQTRLTLREPPGELARERLCTTNKN